MKATYRILTAEGRIKFTGSDIGSWFTLETAKKLVNRTKNEMIYEYNKEGDRLWEVV